MCDVRIIISPLLIRWISARLLCWFSSLCSSACIRWFSQSDVIRVSWRIARLCPWSVKPNRRSHSPSRRPNSQNPQKSQLKAKCYWSQVGSGSKRGPNLIPMMVLLIYIINSEFGITKKNQTIDKVSLKTSQILKLESYQRGLSRGILQQIQKVSKVPSWINAKDNEQSVN